jgi:hypothetical protein
VRQRDLLLGVQEWVLFDFGHIEIHRARGTRNGSNHL